VGDRELGAALGVARGAAPELLGGRAWSRRPCSFPLLGHARVQARSEPAVGACPLGRAPRCARRCRVRGAGSRLARRARTRRACVPADNLAGRVVERSGGGVVVRPGDTPAFLSAAETLFEDPSRRAELGGRARAYAEAAFDVGEISRRFEAVLEGAMAARS